MTSPTSTLNINITLLNEEEKEAFIVFFTFILCSFLSAQIIHWSFKNPTNKTDKSWISFEDLTRKKNTPTDWEKKGKRKNLKWAEKRIPNNRITMRQKLKNIEDLVENLQKEKVKMKTLSTEEIFFSEEVFQLTFRGRSGLYDRKNFEWNDHLRERRTEKGRKTFSITNN